jgi:hypothetical protein
MTQKLESDGFYTVQKHNYLVSQNSENFPDFNGVAYRLNLRFLEIDENKEFPEL